MTYIVAQPKLDNNSRSSKGVDVCTIMYNKVLVPLDGSKFSEQALQHAKALVSGFTTNPIVILFWAIEALLPLESGRSVEKYAEEEEKYEASAKEYLDKVAEDFQKDGITTETLLPKISHGTAANEILNYAKENGVDIIVMTTHGRSGVARWAFGSVAEKVIRHAEVPVFVIPPHGARL